MKKKCKKLVVFVFITLISFFSVLTEVKAIPSTLKTSGNPTLLNGYVGGTKFYLIPLTDGTITYCLNIHKSVPKSQTLHLVGKRDAGIAYLIEHGYPRKSIVGNRNKDYYITQTAIWWYLDRTTNSANLSNEFKTSSSDPEGLRPHIKKLVNGAIAAKNAGYPQPTLTLSAASTGLDLNEAQSYFESKEITISGKYISTAVTLSLQTAPAGTEITDISGNKKTSFSVGEKFKVRVPFNSLKGTSADIKVLASATGSINMAYEYKPKDNSLQNVVTTTLYPTDVPASTSINLKASTSIVKITKIDQNTKQPLAGALLVLKDSSGKTITSWTSTTNMHQITNLPNGTYILKESKAPKGYKLNSEPITFTISDTQKEITIQMENKPKSNVVNILKVDKSTGRPLAGATLVVKDSKDNVVARFVTTEESYTLQDLEDGTYTVEEEKAPNGYVRSEEKIAFTIDDEHLSHQITFENHPETIVPFTSTSTIMYGLGTIILLSGLGFVYYHAKKKKV